MVDFGHPPSAILTAMTAGQTPTPDGPAILCRDVRKRYRSANALNGVSLEVARGSLYGFLGPNGAGKSTLVKILTGLVTPSGGQVSVLGGRPRERQVQARLGYLPELFRFPGWLTGSELLDFHARLLGIRGDADRLCALVGLASAKDRRIGEYSKGMQQRLGLAQALVGDPDLVFLDEPTSALDPLGRLDVRDVLIHLRERGTAVFLNSHLLTEVEKVCDQVAVIDRGRIVAQGSTDELLSRGEVHIRVGDQPTEAIAAFARRIQSGAAGPAGTGLAPAGFGYADGVVTAPVASTEEVPSLVKAAVASGLPIFEVTPARRSLEDMFVELLGTGEARAPAGDRPPAEPPAGEEQDS
jgi:ABC-2 type transport system ATP-binding protein